MEEEANCLETSDWRSGWWFAEAFLASPFEVLSAVQDVDYRCGNLPCSLLLTAAAGVCYRIFISESNGYRPTTMNEKEKGEVYAKTGPRGPQTE